MILVVRVKKKKKKNTVFFFLLNMKAGQVVFIMVK